MRLTRTGEVTGLERLGTGKPDEGSLVSVKWTGGAPVRVHYEGAPQLGDMIRLDWTWGEDYNSTVTDLRSRHVRDTTGH